MTPPMPDPGALVADFPCSALSVTYTPDRTARVSGFLESAADLDRLRARLAAVPGVEGLNTSAVGVAPRPLCGVLTALEPWRYDDGPRVTLSQPDGQYRPGQFLQIAVEPRVAPSHLHVAFIEANDRLVLHMLPNPVRRETAVGPDQTVRIGAPGPTGAGGERAYEVTPPGGRNMIMVAESDRPLFGEPRPEVEPLQDFLEALLRAEAERGANLRFSYRFLDIVAP